MPAEADDSLDKAMQDGGSIGAESLEAVLRKQIEYYFSRENLAHDFYLVSMMDQEMWVPISEIMKFQKVIDLEVDEDIVISAMKESKTVVIDEVGKRIRPSFKISKSTLILRDIPSDSAVGEVKMLFGQYSAEIVTVRPEIGNTWFVTFKTDEVALKMLERIRGMRWNGRVIGCRVKSEGLLKVGHTMRWSKDSEDIRKCPPRPYAQDPHQFYSRPAVDAPGPPSRPMPWLRSGPYQAPFVGDNRPKRENLSGAGNKVPDRRQGYPKYERPWARNPEGERSYPESRGALSTGNRDRSEWHGLAESRRAREKPQDNRKGEHHTHDQPNQRRLGVVGTQQKQASFGTKTPKIDINTCPPLSDASADKPEAAIRTFSGVAAMNRPPSHQSAVPDKEPPGLLKTERNPSTDPLDT